MKLYLVRHGEALSSDINPTSPLSETGKLETVQVARLLKGCDVEIDEILHSVKERAKETAEILGSVVAPDVTLIQREGMKPMDPIDPFYTEIQTYDRNVMLVGHLPFMERLLTTLIYHKESRSPVNFCGSCVVCLEGEGRTWTIAWAVSPRLVGHVGVR